MIKTDQPTLFDRTKLLSAVSSKEDGSMKILHGNVLQAVAYREQFLKRLGTTLDDAVLLYVGDQTVWDAIRDVDNQDRGAGMRDPSTAITGDALVTNQKGIVLFLYTADCNAIIIHDPVHEVVALVHLGWQSTAVDLAGKVIAHLQRHYGSAPADLLIYNGPSIRAESYVLEPPLAQMGLPGWEPYLIELPGGTISVDLLRYNRQQFIDAGVLEDHMEVCPIDTARSADYFSHYRANRQGKAADEGRFVTVCMLR